MKIIVFLLFISFTFACYDYSHHGKDWECVLCHEGERQSPINIDSLFMDHNSEPPCAGMAFKFYPQVEMETINNGNTFQTDVTFSTFGLVDIDKHHSHYNVTQFHFHAPSEHTVNQQRYDLEIHIVASRIDGDSQNLTVIGILFEVTDDPEEEAVLFKEYVFPREREGSHVHQMRMDFKKIFDHVLDDNTHAYRYKGSLTTGSCAENVNWYVIKDPLKITQAKYENFQYQWTHRDAMPEGNNREIQAVNGRLVEIVKFCSSLADF